VRGRVFAAAAVVLLLVVVGALIVLSGRRPTWTTSSPQALAEFEAGLDALQKVYTNEAIKDFEAALRLDPDFVAAERFLLTSLQLKSGDPQAKELIDELKKADLAKLTDRERFLVSYTLAAYEKDPARAAQVLRAFASKHPDDPFALEILAGEATARQDWAEAKRLLTRLIEVAPNRVTAYNQLGYLEMGQGQFAESEKMFQTYRYIAPDQANPHDSLAELLILTGKYDRAGTELKKALEIRPDFCASYQHLAELALVDGRSGDAEAAVAGAERASACSPQMLKVMRCEVASWRPFLAGDWAGVWSAERGSCGDLESISHVLEVWSAVATGRRADAEAIVKKVQEKAAAMPAAAPDRRMSEALAAHLEGALLLADGKPAEAVDRFRLADQGLAYRELTSGLIKLLNRYVLARALRASGKGDEADAMVAEVEAVNAKYAARLAVATAALPGR
jgi:tetratricopeptide (TPR) repeat protein